MLKNISKKLLAFSLLLGGLLFARFVLAQDFGTEIVNNGLNGSLGQANTDPKEVAARIINFALGFLSIIAVGIVLYAGFLWMSSNGEEDKVTKAKQILRNGVIGLLIVLSSWTIATFAIMKLGGAIGGGSGGDGSGCADGEIRSCGCGGTMTCYDKSFGDCVGASLEKCSNPPKSCDSSSTPGCQAASQICSPGYYCDDSCLCQAKAELGESCNANSGGSSNPVCEADNELCADYLTCNPNSCLCEGPPVITGLSPLGGFCNNNLNKACSKDSDCGNNDTCNIKTANGAPNNFITISGKNFGDFSATTSKVIFLGSTNAVEAVSPKTINPLCVGSWHNDQIIVAIPSGVETGPIKVINKDSLEDVTNNTYGPSLPDFVNNVIKRPGLCNIDPIQGALSSEVNYQGVNLYSGTAYFGNYRNNVSGLYSNFTNIAGLSGTSTTPNIKEGESGSFVETVVAGSLQKSNYLKFTKAAEEGEGPYIMSFSPSEGAPGQYVTVRGSGFGGAKEDSKVYFTSGVNKIEAVYTFPAICANSVWSDKQIIIKVPNALVNGAYKIEIQIGENTLSTQNLNPNIFKVDSALVLGPSLCKMDPEKGPIDTPVTFWGEYFGLVGSNGLIRFNYNQNTNGIIKKEKDADTTNATVPKASITGPVKIIKGSVAGNELNFSVSECTNNDECDNKVCCPQNTYRKGRCVSGINECFIDIPSSVFEWSFSTSFDASSTPTFSSCLGLSKYLGSCYQGAMCPNSPGACSSPSVSYNKVVGTCDLNCNNVPGCTSATCAYDVNLDRCVSKLPATCDLPVSITFNPAAYSAKILKDYVTEKFCNSKGNWEIVSSGSCPIGWTRGLNNSCVQNNSSCNLCSENLSCQTVGTQNKCVSKELCSDKGASCLDNLANPAQADNCTIKVEPSCECCCRIGKDSEDCCAPLTCAGKCGSDVTSNTNTYGSCSGCASVGTTQAEHDNACNCSNSSGKFCSISTENPQGICTDCEGITDQTTCGDHSSACCYDANKTVDTTTDDFCRGVGGNSILNLNRSRADYGYCAFFGCDANSPTICASTTPIKVGNYTKADDCIDGCLKNPSDVCANFKTKESCSNESKCCYDSKTSTCKSGSQISDGLNNGYCAYFDCQSLPFGDPYTCNFIATTTGKFSNTAACSQSCANPPGGAGTGCSSSSDYNSCDLNLCSASGLSCLQDNGAGGAFPSCGTCCCQPASANGADSCITPSTPDLRCKADQGSCSGASRGLCCGCKNDGDCGSAVTTGCGSDTCCQARPKVASTSPIAEATNICRNAAIKVTFDQEMDANSFASNFVLFEEKTYGNGVCPPGTFLSDADATQMIARAQNKNILVLFWENISKKVISLLSKNKALALAPSPTKLYCSVPGTVSSENNGDQTSLIFTPSKALSPAARHFAVVKGDEILNSQSGVLSAVKIGMNEGGFRDANMTNRANPVKFNNQTYTNAYSFQFTTLSDQGVSAGICAVDHVSLTPSSYLFKTTVNDLNEKDEEDNIDDRDKVFIAGAYSLNNQLLYSVPGYSWNWDWVVTDTNVAEILTNPLSSNLATSSKIIVAKPGVTDGQTRVSATVNMDKYIYSCGANCNVFNAGNKETSLSDLYVFICANPWPAQKIDGSWTPWNDVGGNCTTGNCEGYNYKFYYCRDAGAPGTNDDLPAINNSPISNSGNLLCNSNNAPCSSINSTCDSGKGVCLWNILKESYFFRESVLDNPIITDLIDTLRGGEIEIKWASASANVSAYKVYYLSANKGVMLSKEYKVSGADRACNQVGQNFNCSAKINGLTDGLDYIFKVSVISNSKTESAFSPERLIKTSDKTPPATPANLKAVISGSNVNFSWTANIDDTAKYRLYYGIVSGKYGESIDSTGSSNGFAYSLKKFSEHPQYFALSAFDSAENESGKSAEKIFYFNTQDNPVTIWTRAVTSSDMPLNTKCLVKMDADQTDPTKAICNENLNFKNPRLFVGTTSLSGISFCAVKGCTSAVNPNKCKYYSGSWSNNCYIPNK